MNGSDGEQRANQAGFDLAAPPRAQQLHYQQRAQCMQQQVLYVVGQRIQAADGMCHGDGEGRQRTPKIRSRIEGKSGIVHIGPIALREHGCAIEFAYGAIALDLEVIVEPKANGQRRGKHTARDQKHSRERDALANSWS